MEPVEAPLTIAIYGDKYVAKVHDRTVWCGRFDMIYTIHTTISTLEQKTEQIYVSGFGDSTVFTTHTIGWFAWLQGSYESIFLGTEKPDLAVGDKVKITIEKEGHANG